MFNKKKDENIRVGKPDTKVTISSHTDGVLQGNAPGHYEKQPGHLADETSTAERSTGINPDARNPIDPRMPNLTPP